MNWLQIVRFQLTILPESFSTANQKSQTVLEEVKVATVEKVDTIEPWKLYERKMGTDDGKYEYLTDLA